MKFDVYVEETYIIVESPHHDMTFGCLLNSNDIQAIMINNELNITNEEATELLKYIFWIHEL